MRLRIKWLAWLLSSENLWAFILCLILVVLVIFTEDDVPLWIYQGF